MLRKKISQIHGQPDRILPEPELRIQRSCCVLQRDRFCIGMQKEEQSMGAESFPHYIRSGQTMLRCGYTTGTCAALAAAGAARLLLSGEVPGIVSLTKPKGI